MENKIKDLFHKWIWHKDDEKVFDINDAIKTIGEVKKMEEDINALVNFIKKEGRLFTETEILALKKEFFSAFESVCLIRYKLMELIRTKTGLRLE